MEPDPHGDEEGRYLVTSMYYDSADYKAYWDKIQGHRFRRKLRVRVYGSQEVTPDTSCFVEIKQRNNRAIQKKRVVLPYSSAIALCGSGAGVNSSSGLGQAVIDEVKYLCSTLQLQSACIVTYDRLAFDGTECDPGLRVTFDTNMKGRTHDLSLLSPNYAQNRFFLPPQWRIMEIKANDCVPYWLTKLTGEYHCTLRRISKYCTALEQCLGLFQTQRITC
jgi:SPX domain protein involved in polyphosphate accumulation